jgi:hypothetical protein
MRSVLVGVALIALSASQAASDEHQDYLNALGMALPDSATGKLVFYDHGGERLLIEEITYPVTFAQESFCPDKVVIGGISIRTGQHEVALVRKLGGTYRVVEDSHEQAPDSFIVYFRSLILEYPNTLRYYALSELQKLGGWFRVLEWALPGSAHLRVHLYSPAKGGPYVARLLDLTLPPVSPDSVSYAPGNRHLLVRPGSPGATWDIGLNVVAIGR